MRGADRRRMPQGAGSQMGRLTERVLDDATIVRMTELFKAMGDPTRLRIVSALSPGELCVRDIASSVGLSQSAVSHQMKTLRDLHLVRAHKEGRRVFYSLDDDHVHYLFHQGLDHVRHDDSRDGR